MDTEDWVGGAWLAARYAVELVMPLAVKSRIGGRRASRLVDGVRTETFVAAMRPGNDLRGHLTFHLKHEVLHLELLCRVFERIAPADLSAWIEDEPSGQYARRAGFLFEWLTGRMLQFRVAIAGPYVDAIDDQKLVAASEAQAVLNRRWRLRDNLPGSSAFCPIIRKTDEFNQAITIDIKRLLTDLAEEFGSDLLMRSSVWMTLRESRSSFAIEGEPDQSDRVNRFAQVLAQRTGEGALPLDQATLSRLQVEILGPRTALQQFGIRRSPVFVGEMARFQPVVHYVAPPAADLQRMLEGLATFWERTEGQSAVMRSAVMAFGFVYIHPLADGNGRVHRFLINDALRRAGLIEAPMILPVSSLVTRDASERRSYDRILDEVSRPLMAALAGHYEFSSTQTAYPDGIRSNLHFKGESIGRPVWRYPDLTRHVIYLADVMARTITEDMREESRYLRNHTQARAAIKDVVEMPDFLADRIIRSIAANGGQLSNALRKEIPILSEPGVWDDLVQAVTRAFV